MRRKQLNELLVNYFNAQESEAHWSYLNKLEILAKKAAEVVLRFMRRYQAEKSADMS